ncbi:hypothetical protein ANN_18432 [Periplaneta americana]|uniref:Uncharacterized protein n=1 Tax=Periplaneta americana TaxID=6978 RepID=A0ABQ8SPD9_PERAM|nr:hypothetical protein ANN_18432 [Periplaneta americana]
MRNSQQKWIMKKNIYNPTISYYLQKYQLKELEVIGLLVGARVNMDTKHLICTVECCRTQPMISNTLRTTCPRKTQFERGYGSTQTLQTDICCYNVQAINRIMRTMTATRPNSLTDLHANAVEIHMLMCCRQYNIHCTMNTSTWIVQLYHQIPVVEGDSKQYFRFSTVNQKYHRTPVVEGVSKRCFRFTTFKPKETEGQKTNNGIQYRLQLLYANAYNHVFQRVKTGCGAPITRLNFNISTNKLLPLLNDTYLSNPRGLKPRLQCLVLRTNIKNVYLSATPYKIEILRFSGNYVYPSNVIFDAKYTLTQDRDRWRAYVRAAMKSHLNTIELCSYYEWKRPYYEKKNGNNFHVCCQFRQFRFEKYYVPNNSSEITVTSGDKSEFYSTLPLHHAAHTGALIGMT